MWLVYRRGIIETSKTRHFNWKYFLSLWLLPTTTFYICKNTPVTVILRRSYPVFTTTKKEKVIEPRGAYVIRYASHNHKHIHTFTVTISVLSPSNFGCVPTEKKNAACNRRNLLINDNLRLFFYLAYWSHTNPYTFLFSLLGDVFFGHSKLGARALWTNGNSTAHTSRSLPPPNALKWLNVFRLKSGKDIMASLGPFPLTQGVS